MSKKNGATKARADEAPLPRVAKRNLTVYLPADLVEEISHACGWLSGPPHFLTRSGLAEDALAAYLERLRRMHNGGKSFSKPPGFGLRRGRPVKPVER